MNHLTAAGSGLLGKATRSCGPLDLLVQISVLNHLSGRQSALPWKQSLTGWFAFQAGELSQYLFVFRKTSANTQRSGKS
ncbi:MAG: hypothetical protein CMJ81_17785 [Planctomycetaceae bacterium]|nr:hypothetical protein [Planctomycetaceae bacterium]